MQLIPGLTNNKYLHTDSKNFLGQQLVIKQDDFKPKRHFWHFIFINFAQFHYQATTWSDIKVLIET